MLNTKNEKMRTQIKILRKDKFLGTDVFFDLLDDFINDASSGIRLKKNGEKISLPTISNYYYFKRIVKMFVEHTSFKIKLFIVNNLNQNELEYASIYWNKFYNNLLNYLYTTLNKFDNYVGSVIKNLKAFLNYLVTNRLINIGLFHKSFYAPKEEIDIIALSAKQLNYVIFNKTFNLKVKQLNLEEIRDTFVIGCTVALRVSDLLRLSPENLMIYDGNYYLHIKSQKTKTKTKIKLPSYAIDIIKKYEGKFETLLPTISISSLDLKIKKLGKLLPDDFILIKTRERRGKPIIVYKNKETKEHFKLSDHLTSHTMRRTAITNMLSLGVPEFLTRKISGHAANSKEFYRYVMYSQNFIDSETDLFFEKMKSI